MDRYGMWLYFNVASSIVKSQKWVLNHCVPHHNIQPSTVSGWHDQQSRLIGDNVGLLFICVYRNTVGLRWQFWKGIICHCHCRIVLRGGYVQFACTLRCQGGGVVVENEIVLAWRWKISVPSQQMLLYADVFCRRGSNRS